MLTKLETQEDLLRKLNSRTLAQTTMMEQLTERENKLKQEYAKLQQRHINQVQQYSNYIEWKRQRDEEKETAGNNEANSKAQENNQILQEILEKLHSDHRDTEQINLTPTILALADDKNNDIEIKNLANECLENNKQDIQETVSSESESDNGIENPVFQPKDQHNSSLFEELQQANSLPVDASPENVMELEARKQALNIVKDDLMSKLEKLTEKHNITVAEIDSIKSKNKRLENKCRELEEDLKQYEMDEDAIPDDMPRKRFTRTEMMRVLMERNQYKERLMELEEAVQLQESVRAQRKQEFEQIDRSSSKKGSIWAFFSKLIPASQPSSTVVSPKVETNPGITKSHTVASGFDTPNSSKRSPQRPKRIARSRIPALSSSDCQQVCGWAFPNSTVVDNGDLEIPLPQYCHPIDNTESSKTQLAYKVWCAKISDNLIWIGSSNSRGKSFITAADVNEPKRIIAKSSTEDSTITTMEIISLPEKNFAKTRKYYQAASGIVGERVMDNESVMNSEISFIQQPTIDEEEVLPVVSTRYPCLFAGCQNGDLIVYSIRLPNILKTDLHDVPEILHPSARLKLPSSIVKITVHWTCEMTRPLVFVALANGTLVMFQRTMGVPHESPTEEPVWDLTKYHLIRLCPQDNQISDLISLDRYIWAGIANQIFVIDTLMHGDDQLGYAKSVADQVPPRVVACFEAHPRQESRIKTFSEDTLTNGQNVWVSVRLDSVVRLFSAKAPDFQHLMDVDIEPFVSSIG